MDSRPPDTNTGKRLRNVVVAWSGGKDCALALYLTLAQTHLKVAGLLTTITEDYGRVSMHGVREVLLEEQAKALGLPLFKVGISANCSNSEYEEKMSEMLSHLRGRGVESVVFGDIFLEDVRAFREKNLASVGMRGAFPLWGINSQQVADNFVRLGFKALVVCVDTEVLNATFVGREFNEEFLRMLPADVDPCGENGEFHTFVYDGPIFRQSVSFERGRVVLREERFCFCDLLPRR